MKNSTVERSKTERTLFRKLYNGDAKLDEKTLDELSKRWVSEKTIKIFWDDEFVFDSQYGFVKTEWFVQQALIMLEDFEKNNEPFVHSKHKLPTTTIAVNGRLHDALQLKADQYHCGFEEFVLSLVHAYASHCAKRVTA